jgi:hypothetical protein
MNGDAHRDARGAAPPLVVHSCAEVGCVEGWRENGELVVCSAGRFVGDAAFFLVGRLVGTVGASESRLAQSPPS